MFAKKPQPPAAPEGVLVYAPDAAPDLKQRLGERLGGLPVTPIGDEPTSLDAADAVVALPGDPSKLTPLMHELGRVRARRGDGTPVLVAGLTPDRLTAFGGWLAAAAADGLLQGIRLVVGNDEEAILRQLSDKLVPVTQPNIIAMPVTTDVETTTYRYFYCISPELRAVLDQIGELAANNIDRLYLLGGPGAGKTSLAYYFHLARGRDNFVAVNLTAESTDDKAAMKSLLCGHVTGAFPGAGSRTGAFSHARGGVAFLDEAHGVSGSVMEVLMEALDSGQYLPYGASTKRPLDCAVVFASNRDWDTLIGSVNIDEHARLGAVILHLPDLAGRREDLIAVLATTLDRLAARTTTWAPPAGLSPDAWETICHCPWRGNTRALIRVAETAFVDAATRRSPLIEAAHVERAIGLWEPAHHASHDIYTRDGAGAASKVASLPRP